MRSAPRPISACAATFARMSRLRTIVLHLIKLQVSPATALAEA